MIIGSIDIITIMASRVFGVIRANGCTLVYKVRATIFYLSSTLYTKNRSTCCPNIYGSLQNMMLNSMRYMQMRTMIKESCKIELVW